MSATGVEAGPSIRITSDMPDCRSVVAELEATVEVPVTSVGPAGTPFSMCLYTLAGRTAIFTEQTLTEIVNAAKALERDELPTENAYAVVEHDVEISKLPIPNSGPLSVGTRRILGPCGWVDPTVRPEPIAEEIDTESVFDRVRAVGLRGRGRADGAAGEVLTDIWKPAAEAEGEPVVVVHTADTDCRIDELLCRSVPGYVLDGARTVAEAIGATDVAVMTTEPSFEPLEVVADGEIIHRAPDSFLIGEPTMALEALEGNDRIEARRRPPGPEEWGLYGRPTVIHTPRTLLQLRALLDGAAFDPENADPGTRLVSVRGAVTAPAVVELRTESSLSKALEAVEPGGERYVVGGKFGGFTESLDLPASVQALSAAGFGTEGVVEVLGPGECVVATVGERAAFARETNCGRCVPCREGSKQLHESLRSVYDGKFDPEALRTLSRVMGATSLCAFGEAAARPITTALEAFEPEFRAHAEGRCPAGSCGGLQ